MRRSMTVPVVLALWVGVALAEDRGDLATRAAAIRPTAAETKYKRIPWVTDVFQGFEMAKVENRPVFIYIITGDPLEDC